MTTADDGLAKGMVAILSEATRKGCAVRFRPSNHDEVVGTAFSGAYCFASPKALGELRKHYGKPLSGVIEKEIAKDLTGHSIPDIEKAIAAA